MNYQYKVYREIEISKLHTSFNYYASIGFRVIISSLDNDDYCFYFSMNKNIDSSMNKNL